MSCETLPPTRIVTADAGDLAWAAKIIGNGLWPDETVGIAIYRDGVRKAVLGYNAFYDNGCSAHIASDGSAAWVSRAALSAMFFFPFIQMNLERITAPIGVKNIKAQIFALKLGFSFDGRVRYVGEDKIMFGMLRHECTWLGRNSNG